MSLEHLVVPESKEVLKTNKQKQNPATMGYVKKTHKRTEKAPNMK